MMRFKDFIKIQSENCPNTKIRSVWVELLSKFKTTIYSETYETQKKAKTVFDNVCKQKAEDDIDKKRIWIMNFYTNKDLENLGLKSSDNVKSGFKSLISDDIISDDGDEYVYIGKSPYYKFYLKDDTYYFRVIGNTTLNRVNEWNQSLVSDYIEYLNYK